MALTKYEIVNANGLKGVYFEGREVPLSEIDDELAERMEGKTHILKKKSAKAIAAATAEAAK